MVELIYAYNGGHAWRHLFRDGDGSGGYGFKSAETQAKEWKETVNFLSSGS